jgi:hypothetical protein
MDGEKIRAVVLFVLGLALLIRGVTQWLGWVVITLSPIVYLISGTGMIIYGVSQAT